MFKRLLSTRPELSSLILRLCGGVVMFPHGAQKLLGWFGGSGYAATMKGLSEGMGLPSVIVFLVIVLEFFGGLFLIAGFLTRLFALGLSVIMFFSIYLVHWPQGFFMNWFGKMEAGQEGFEYHILAIAVYLALVLKGGGLLSVDRALSLREQEKRADESEED